MAEKLCIFFFRPFGFLCFLSFFFPSLSLSFDFSLFFSLFGCKQRIMTDDDVMMMFRHFYSTEREGRERRGGREKREKREVGREKEEREK